MKRNEYPRPNFVRPDWLSLNGPWQFAFDDENIGLAEKWFLGKPFPLTIEVPFAFQTPLSGINDQSFHDFMWYRRTFTLNKLVHKRYLLHFQAVDYECRVYVNKEEVGHHIGGQAPFSFDVTELVDTGTNEIVVYVNDPSTDEYMPRGKQYWKEKSEIIWYNRTSGIWQSVWLEIVDEVYIKHLKITPHYDAGEVEFSFTLSAPNKPLLLIIPSLALKESLTPDTTEVSLHVKVLHTAEDFITKSWTPENPYLFDFSVTYGKDVVTSYFGMRKVHAENGQTYLNNKPYYMKLVLDQGYWPEGLLTAPSTEALKFDIEITKAMGFNGARKHQKCEDPYFMYYADHLGFLVWGEMASSIKFNETSAWRDKNEWEQILRRDYNHPAIVAWVPLNESWGVPDIGTNKRQQQHAIELYNLIKAYDQTRFIVGNDGWEQVITDICAIHNYKHGAIDDLAAQDAFARAISSKAELLASRPADRPIYAAGYEHQGEPILLTEFGGISYEVNDKGWGYTAVANSDTLLTEYKRLILAIKASSGLAGYCYTQLTDVEQEVNGLLTYDRKPKVAVEKVKEVNDLIQK